MMHWITHHPTVALHYHTLQLLARIFLIKCYIVLTTKPYFQPAKTYDPPDQYHDEVSP
jgi:hypothetical protein